MKHLRKFEGFFDTFKGEEENEKKEKISLEGSKFFATPAFNAHGKSSGVKYNIFYKSSLIHSGNHIASVELVDGNMILTIYSKKPPMNGRDIKVKSVEDSLKYLEKIKSVLF